MEVARAKQDLVKAAWAWEASSFEGIPADFSYAPSAGSPSRALPEISRKLMAETVHLKTAGYQSITASRSSVAMAEEPRYKTATRPHPRGTSLQADADLQLDHDVADLLERAQQAEGKSSTELVNDLLRKALTQNVAQMEEARLEKQIDRLYDEIHDLVSRSVKSPDLKPQIARKREELRALQTRAAEAWRTQAEARLHLKRGEGYRLLEEAKEQVTRVYKASRKAGQWDLKRLLEDAPLDNVDLSRPRDYGRKVDF